MRKIITLVILFSSFFSIVGNSQNQSADHIVIDFDTHRKNNFSEKVYLHLDRPSYLTGETIWFKVYLVDANQHTPSDLSKVVYVEIYSQDLQPIVQGKVEVKDGVGAGSFYIPASISTGQYRIRAYTNWMKNYDTDYFFQHDIAIVNPFVGTNNTSKKIAPTFDAQFFPEGGALVAGLMSKVAFQVTDAEGSGMRASGILIDENRDTVSTFSTYRFGIGHFKFTPHADKKYSTIINDENGNEKRFEFPVVLPFGYVLEVEEDNDERLGINIQTNIIDAESVYLFIHTRNQIVTSTVIQLKNGSGSYNLALSDLHDGISHITIFDRKMKPICERLYFKKPIPQESVTISTNQKVYGKRSSVKIDLNVGAKTKSEEFSLSASVFKIDSMTTNSINIQNYLLLTADLKGSVESPEFYFQATAEAKQAADNLMLTHGWRRFVWDEIINEVRVEKDFIPEIRGHIIQASIKNKDGSPAAGVIGFLSAPGKVIRVYPARSNNSGKLYFEMLNFYGPNSVVLQKNNTEDSVSTLEINSPFSTQFSNQRFSNIKLLQSWQDQLVERSVAMQVENIFHNDLRAYKLASIDSTAFYGIADATYMLDDFTRFPVMEEVIREYVPGIFLVKRKDGFRFLVLDKEPNSTFRVSPLILLDGVPIFDEDEIMVFDPRLIKKLEVVQQRWYQGPAIFFGIVSFSTYQGDLAGFSVNPSSLILEYEGLQLQREFYTPKYESKKQRDGRVPDQRVQLYWNPTITPDENGQVQLQFYSSDVAGEYRVVIEGINKHGETHTSSTSFIVRDSN